MDIVDKQACVATVMFIGKAIGSSEAGEALTSQFLDPILIFPH